MNRLGAIAIVLCVAGTAGAQEREIRARAAKDLVCPAKKVKLQVWEGGAKVEARGCGRNAEYERQTDGQLHVAMLEMQPTAEMRRQAMADLECTAKETEVTRAFRYGDGETLHAFGCGRDAQYDVVEGGLLKMTGLTRPAPAEVIRRAAADLGCPEVGLEVNLTKDESGTTTATAKSCKDGAVYRYTLEPFKRITAPPPAPPTTQADLAKRAAQDLGCDVATLTIATQPGKDPETATVDGCGRRATYVRNATGYVLSSGPVNVQAPPK